MTDKRIIEQALEEQFDELTALEELELCRRREETLVDLESNMAQVVIGVRRSGKSTLCYQALKNRGVKFAYANFDDERLATLIMDDLNTVLEVLYKIYGDFKHLFLDEVQNIDGWHLFVNRLLRQRLHVIVTGSNAKLLSGELATHLTGRNETTELFPFSFADFCRCKGVNVHSQTTKAEALRRKAFDDYLRQGGFPELLNKENKARYVSTLVDNILKRDIEQRHSIKYVEAFERLAQYLMNVAPAIVVEDELVGVIGVKSNHTISNYIGFLKQAYLLIGLRKYSVKSRQRVRAEKLYPVDVSLMNGRPDTMAGENLGWRLETVVYIELLRRNRPMARDIYYFKSADGYESDFVVCRGNVVEAIYQVCYDLSKEKTRRREIRGLLAASKETHCDNLYLITDFQREELEVEGKSIHVVPAYDWLVNE